MNRSAKSVPPRDRSRKKDLLRKAGCQTRRGERSRSRSRISLTPHLVTCLHVSYQSKPFKRFRNCLQGTTPRRSRGVTDKPFFPAPSAGSLSDFLVSCFPDSKYLRELLLSL